MQCDNITLHPLLNIGNPLYLSQALTPKPGNTDSDSLCKGT